MYPSAKGSAQKAILRETDYLIKEKIMKKKALIGFLVLISFCFCQLVYARPAKHPYVHNKHPKVVKKVVVVHTPAPIVVVPVATAPSVVVSERETVSQACSSEVKIEQGIKSGELTEDEAAQLKEGQKEIQDLKSKADSDGVITENERAEIKNKINEENQKIYNEKHDTERR